MEYEEFEIILDKKLEDIDEKIALLYKRVNNIEKINEDITYLIKVIKEMKQEYVTNAVFLLTICKYDKEFEPYLQRAIDYQAPHYLGKIQKILYYAKVLFSILRKENKLDKLVETYLIAPYIDIHTFKYFVDKGMLLSPLLAKPSILTKDKIEALQSANAKVLRMYYNHSVYLAQLLAKINEFEDSEKILKYLKINFPKSEHLSPVKKALYNDPKTHRGKYLDRELRRESGKPMKVRSVVSDVLEEAEKNKKESVFSEIGVDE